MALGCDRTAAQYGACSRIRNGLATLGLPYGSFNRFQNRASPFRDLVAPRSFPKCLQRLAQALLAKNQIDTHYCIDSTYVKSIYGRDCVGKNPTDRGRRATKLSAIVNHDGVPISLVPFPANTSDYKTVDATLLNSLIFLKTACPMYADKGYDSRDARASFRSHGYIDRVSRRRTVSHRVVNRRRIVVERFFSWLDKNRRILVRYDALVSHYMSWTWLACCKLIGRRLQNS